MTHVDNLESKTNEIIEAVKKERIFIYKEGRAALTLEWAEVVSLVVDDCDDMLHALYFDNDNSALWLKIEDELQSLALEMAEQILEIEYKAAEEDHAIYTHENI